MVENETHPKKLGNIGMKSKIWKQNLGKTNLGPTTAPEKPCILIWEHWIRATVETPLLTVNKSTNKTNFK